LRDSEATKAGRELIMVLEGQFTGDFSDKPDAVCYYLLRQPRDYFVRHRTVRR